MSMGIVSALNPEKDIGHSISLGFVFLFVNSNFSFSAVSYGLELTLCLNMYGSM